MHTRIHGKAKGARELFEAPLTRTALKAHIDGFLKGVKSAGYTPVKAVLFGSYVNGKPDGNSDVDLALWAEGFEGNLFADFEKIKHLKREFTKIEMHPYAPGETADDDPFIEEIEKTGRKWELPRFD